MNIAYIIPKRINAGPILVVQELVKQMILHGHSCIVFYFDEGQEINFLCPTKKISFSQRIDFNSYDIIHTHGLRPDLYIFLHKPINCKAKCITTLHNYVIPDFSYQYNKFIAYTIGNLWMICLTRHNKIVTLSKDAMQYYKKRFSTKKLTYAYNTRSISLSSSIAEEEKKEILDFKGNSILIGVNAALTDRKGVDQIIKALKKLPNYKLIIIGEGKSKLTLEQLCIDENVSKQVLFLGYKKDAYRFLPYYDLFALPSRSEGFGLTLIESAIYKKNVICSKIPIFQELCPNKEVVFFELENIHSLEQAIQKATNDNTLGEKLYKQYLKEFSPDKFYIKYYSIYNSLLQ